MTALVKNTTETRFAPRPRSAPSGTFSKGVVGFGPVVKTADASESGMLTRTVLAMLLVLYPAMASVALVLAAFMLSGHSLLV